MFPGLAVRGKNAGAHEGIEGSFAGGWQVEVLELSGENRLDVLGVLGRDDLAAEHVEFESASAFADGGFDAIITELEILGKALDFEVSEAFADESDSV